MDETYLYIYEKLYQHLYKFCISGDMDAKKAIKSLKRKKGAAEDSHLGFVIEIITDAVDMQRERFEKQSREYEAAVAPEEQLDLWYLHSILRLVYKYIYPDNEKVKRSENEISKIYEKQDEKGERRYQFEFENADYMIQMHIDKRETVYKEYNKEHNKRNFKLQNRSFMMVLKGYSSSTPFFYPALRERFHDVPIKGGGIYIKWRGTGLVLDPGINFMENMHMSGLGINDIDVVIVTHNHIDHNGDLITIDDLAFQFDKCDIALYMDKQTEKDFDRRLKKIKDRHGVDLTLNPTTEFYIGRKKDICVKMVPTKHIKRDDVRADDPDPYLKNTTYAVKIVFMEDGIKKAAVGFTSDTIYLSELGEAFWDCDYIIANMSETDEKDYRKIKPKENHLGYGGCLQLIKACNDVDKTTDVCAIAGGKQRFIISEFWAGKGDVRKELIKRLRNESGCASIYPGDIGMTFFLDQPTFKCSLCGGEQELKHLHVLRPGMEYSRFCSVCDECILE